MLSLTCALAYGATGFAPVHASSTAASHFAFAQDAGQATSHAALHSPDATFFVQLSSVQDLPKAYESTWVFSLLQDEDLAEAVSKLSQGTFELPMVLDMARMYLNPDTMPEDLAASGLGEVLRTLESASFSVSLPADPTSLLGLRHASNAQLEISALQAQIEFQVLDGDGEYPTSLDGVRDVSDELRTDPWGRPYQIDASGEVFSLGADGEPGGSGLAADVRLGQSTDLEAALLPVLANELGVQLTLACKDAADARALLDMAARRQLREVTEVGQVNGQPVMAAVEAMEAGDVTLHGFLAAHDRQLTFGFGNNRIESFQARLAGRDRSQARVLHLADHADRSAARAALPAPTGTALVESWRTLAWSELAQIGLELAVASGQVDLSDLPVEIDVEELMSFFESGDDGWRGEYTRVQLQPDGRFLKDAVGVGQRPAAWRGTTAGDGALLEFLPASSALVWRTSLSGAGAAEAVLGLLESAAAGVELPTPAELEAKLGFSLSKDLFGLLGDELVMSMDPVRGVGVPGVRAFVRVQQPELFAERLTALTHLVADSTGGLLSVKDRPYRKMPYVAISIEEQAFIQPSFGLVDDVLVIGAKGIGVKRELKRLRDEEYEELPFLSDLSGAADLLYVDWPALIGGAYGTVKAFAGLAAGFAGEDLPLDLDGLPEPEVLERHFRASRTTTRFTEVGRITRTESGFGPEVYALVAGGVAAVGFASEQAVPAPIGYTEEWDEIEAYDPVSETDQTLLALRVGLEAYRYDRGGAYPDQLDALLEANEQFPKGYVTEGTSLEDGWGRAFVYQPTDDGGRYTLRSVGPNGEDDGGVGYDNVLK